MGSAPTSIRVAVIDRETAFQRVLARRFEAAGWEYRFLSSAVPGDELVAMKLNALVVDLGLEIRGDQFQAFVAGQSLQLTRREYELLEMLADSSGTVIQREQIYQR